MSNVIRLNVVFRCDASYLIGQGHLARCLSLAKALEQQYKIKAVFAMGDSGEYFKNAVREAGFGRYDLARRDYGPDEVKELISFIKSNPGNETVCIIDHYQINAAYERALRAQGITVMLIDDLAGRSFCADIILNFHFGAEELVYKNEVVNARYLLGPKYVMLNKPESEIKQKQKGNNVLMTFGSAALANEVSLQVLKFIEPQRKAVEEVDFTLVASTHEASLKAIKEFAKGSSIKLNVLTNVKNMGELIRQATLAVCAGGVTAYEMIFYGKPLILIQMADNQKYVIKGMRAAGVAEYLGPYQELNAGRFTESLMNLFEDKSRRLKMGTKAASLIDGRGALRVCKEMINLITAKV